MTREEYALKLKEKYSTPEGRAYMKLIRQKRRGNVELMKIGRVAYKGLHKIERPLTKAGVRVRSRNEAIAHNFLLDAGIPFDYEVFLPQSGGFTDIKVGDVSIEIDGMRRPEEYWKQKYEGVDTRLVVIPVNFKNRQASIVNRLQEIFQ